MNVSFLGLGAIGAPMARHLAKPPFSLADWNRTKARADAFAADTGARVAGSPADALLDARQAAETRGQVSDLPRLKTGFGFLHSARDLGQHRRRRGQGANGVLELRCYLAVGGVRRGA